MKEIFNIRRFWALAVKFYRENMKTNLLFIAVLVLFTFLCVCQFNPFRIEYFSSYEGSLSRMKYFYMQVFWGILWISSLFVAVYSFREVMSKHKSVNALLLPASVFEKYLLVFLHSTVVILLLNLLVFYSTASIARTYKYVGMENVDITEGWFGMKIPKPVPGQNVVRPEIGNVFDFGKDSRLFSATVSDADGNVGEKEYRMTKALSWNLLVIFWLFNVGFFMWGSITFRKRTVLLTILTHLVVLGALGWIAVKWADMIYRSRPTSFTIKDLWIVPSNPDIWFSPWWLMTLYIFPVTYFIVIWLKLKNKQV